MTNVFRYDGRDCTYVMKIVGFEEIEYANARKDRLTEKKCHTYILEFHDVFVGVCENL